MKSKVLIVDDHKMYRDGLKTLINLQKDMMVVGEAENGQEAIAKDSRAAPRRHPHGRQYARDGWRRSDEPNPRRAARHKDFGLSIQADDGYMASMLCAGAIGYVLKGSNSEKLFGIIRRTAGPRNP